MRTFLTSLICSTFSVVFLLTGCNFHQESGELIKPNILFIAVDDLKPNTGAYGDTLAITPNLDRLSASGITFMNNQCQQAVCAPSRASLLTGRYPDQLRVWDLQTLIREKNPGIITLPQYLKNNGYKTAATGKIFDPRSLEGSWGGPHDPPSWSFDYENPGSLGTYNKNTGPPSYFYASIENKEKILDLQKEAEKLGITDGNEIRNYVKERFFPAFENADVPFDAYVDGALARHGIQLMDSLVKLNSPFFLAVGFNRPHLPFNAPEKYWNMYKREDFSTARFQRKAQNSPEIAYHNSGELRNGYTGIPPDSILPESLQIDLIHGYYAAISYIDEMIGMLINELDTLGIKNNTIVIVWGDHGWHLGDHGLWCKHSNFEQAVRAPMILADFRNPQNNIRYHEPSEFTDIAPTLCEMAGLDIPDYFEGLSLASLFRDPDRIIRTTAFSQYPREGMKYMGYTLRTNRYRYTQWIERETGYIHADELYDYQIDPLETKNLVNDPEYDSILQAQKMVLEMRINDPASHN